MVSPKTLYDKIWDEHLISSENGTSFNLYRPTSYSRSH